MQAFEAQWAAQVEDLRLRHRETEVGCTMKIAVVSNNGMRISAHFGRAQQYVVFTVEDGRVVGREVRRKPVHQCGHQREGGAHPAEDHGFGAQAEARHSDMIAPIQDCDVLLARGMGRGAFLSLQQEGIRPIITDILDVDEAVQALLRGTLEHHPERLH